MTPSQARAEIAALDDRDTEGLSLCPQTGATVWTPPKGMRAPVKGDDSPWGRVDEVWQVSIGITAVITARHGGLWLSRDRVALLPDEWRTMNGDAQWAEEDCEAHFVLWFLLTLDEGAQDRFDRCEAMAEAIPRYRPGWEAMKRKRQD